MNKKIDINEMERIYLYIKNNCVVNKKHNSFELKEPTYKYFNDYLFIPNKTSGLTKEQEEIRKYIDEKYHNETFGQLLTKFLNEHEIKKDSDLYKGANIEKSTFQRNITGETKASRENIYRIAIFMHLSVDETNSLLSKSDKGFLNSDEIGTFIMYCLENNKDTFFVDEFLESIGQKPFFSE